MRTPSINIILTVLYIVIWWSRVLGARPVSSKNPALFSSFPNYNSLMAASTALARGRIQRKKWDLMPELTITSPYIHSRVDLNLMPESTLSPSQGLWIWPQRLPGRQVATPLPPPHSFFSCIQNWDSPNPSPAGECAPPPPGSGGRA
jgi:hypothetical protein